MTVNGYNYGNSNPVNLTDPTGMIAENPGQWNQCMQSDDRCKCCTSWRKTICEISHSLDCPCNEPEVPQDLSLPTPQISGCNVTTGNWDTSQAIAQNNCYSYAIDLLIQDDPETGLRRQVGGLNPGDIGPSNYYDTYYDFVGEAGTDSIAPCDFLTEALRRDRILKAETQVPNECAGNCTDGYPIYLVVTAETIPGYDIPSDYHFYRMDGSGIWTSKLGSGPNGPVTACDGGGNRITDPAMANHNYQSKGGQNYAVSCGYYCVCPHEIEAWKNGRR